MNSTSCRVSQTHLRLRESRAQRLGCELPVVIQAAAEFPRRPAPDVATPLGPLGRALRTLAPGAGRDNQHGDVPPAQPEGGLQPFREKRFIPASFPNPFFHLTVRQTVTRKRALSRETIKRICTADLSALHPKYSLARDIFMFSFFTRGMSFVDMVYLRNSDIHDGVLTYARHKTGQMLSMRMSRSCSTSSTVIAMLRPIYSPYWQKTTATEITASSSAS